MAGNVAEVVSTDNSSKKQAVKGDRRSRKVKRDLGMFFPG